MSWFKTSSPQPPYEIDDAVLTLTQQDAARLEWPLRRTYGRWFLFLICLVLLICAGRLAYLNVIQGGEYQLMAERNSLRSRALVAPRGIIYDRFGTPLVENEPALDAVLIPGDLPSEPRSRATVLQAVYDFFQPDIEQWHGLEEHVASGAPNPVLVRSRLDQSTVVRFLTERARLPGVTLYKTASRHYIDGPVFAHIIGYEGKIQTEELSAHEEESYLLTDSIGKQGIEKSYEPVLRGIHGQERVEVDALGQVKKELGVIPSQKGSDVYLTIDAALQREATALMERFLNQAGLTRGALIALDPRSGAVRALVSVPSYDNNLFVGGISTEAYSRFLQDPNKPLFNRAISGEYPPGSTIKPLLAAGALDAGTITPTTTIESRGGIRVGRFFFGDWKAHGFTDLRRAIAVSSDVYFYSVGGGYGSVPGLGMERMKLYEERFGWGRKTGIDLPGEQDGFLPTPIWKEERFDERWYIGDNYNASIGQGYITTTPLQIVNAIAAIANNGTLYQPRLLEKITALDGTTTPSTPTVLNRTLFSPAILQVVREGMRQTVTDGTAQSLQTLPVPVAGKTGTAQFGGAKQTYGWFVSFAPYDDPELAVVVLVEDQPEHATYHAVPITKALYEWYFARQQKDQSTP